MLSFSGQPWDVVISGFLKRNMGSRTKGGLLGFSLCCINRKSCSRHTGVITIKPHCIKYMCVCAHVCVHVYVLREKWRGAQNN